MVITPVWLDQWDYGTQVGAAGIGVSTRSLTEVTVKELQEAIQKCCSDPEIQENAKSMAAKASQEDGVARAAQIVGDFYRDSVATGLWAAEFEKMAAKYQPDAPAK